jgi:hypothetical protein
VGRDSRYSDRLHAGRSGDRIPVTERFSARVQTGPGAHPSSSTMGTASFLGVKSDRGVTLTPQRLLVPWSRKGRAIPLLPLWAIWLLQGPSACKVELYLYSREEGTHWILLIAHIALCKSRLTPAHCISLIVYLTSYTLYLTSYILHLTSYILHLTSYALRLTSYTLHLTSYILHLISYCIVFCTVWHVYVLCVRHIHDPMLLP